jgi:hypothetical protein
MAVVKKIFQNKILNGWVLKQSQIAYLGVQNVYQLVLVHFY